MIAIAPAIMLLCYFYEQDRHQQKSYGARLRVFLLGLTTVIPAFLIESWIDRVLTGGKLATHLQEIPTGDVEFTPLVDAFLMGFIWSAAVEEAIKIYYLSWIKRLKVFNSQQSAIIYAVVLGLGFATIENISYVLDYFREVPGIAYGRAFLSLPMHAVCAVMMGYFIGEAEFKTQTDRVSLYFRAWAIATLIHGTFNTFLFMGLPFSHLFALLVLLVSLVIAIILYWKTAQTSPSGVLPTTPPLQPSVPLLDKSENNRVAAENHKLANRITTLINRSLQPKGVTAKVTCVDDRLKVLLLAAKPLPQSAAEWVHRGVTKLAPKRLQSLEVMSKQFGSDQPFWQREFSLADTPLPTPAQAPVISLAKPVMPIPQSAPRPITHHGFSLMAVLCGFLADTLLTYIISVSIFIGLKLSLNQSAETMKETFQSLPMALAWISICLLCTALGGMLTVHLARVHPLRHTLAMGLLSTAAGFFDYSLTSPFPLWLDALFLVLPLLTAVAGGYLYWSLKSALHHFQYQKSLSPQAG